MRSLVAVPDQVITSFGIADLHFINTTVDISGYRLVASHEFDLVQVSIHVRSEFDYSPVPRKCPSFVDDIARF